MCSMARALHSPRKPDVRECVHCAVRVVQSTLGSGRMAGAAQAPPITARPERRGPSCAHSVWSAPGRGARRGWPAYPIKSKLVSVGKLERAISVSGYINRGWVKIARSAYDKVSVYKGRSRNHLLYQLTGFRIGVQDKDDDLFDAAIYTIALAASEVPTASRLPVRRGKDVQAGRNASPES
jgi:hypothetical protein